LTFPPLSGILWFVREVKERLDLILVQRGLAESRERAQQLILAGEVSVAGALVDKPGTRVSPGAAVQVTGRLPYVSRGGF
jgi:23S rRNA (cytidine1920-2'-O)/16S rRNA (cytidine1409-2'-O)-methyltransferase